MPAVARRNSGELSVTLLELLAGAARARIVAADLRRQAAGGCEHALPLHRQRLRLLRFLVDAESAGVKKIVGGFECMAGVVAALTTLPVIAVPMATTVLSGIDALLSSVQMPAGVPVAAMAIDKPGAINAAIYAAEIIATFDPRVAEQK